MSTPLFKDRVSAGEKLADVIAAEMAQLSQLPDKVIVYALPRGGLPVAAPIAHRLGCPLDVVVSKKITRPDNPELAIGAVTADGHVLWSSYKPRHFRQQQAALQQARSKAQAQLEKMSSVRPDVHPQGALVILVDDGIATGMTIAAAAESVALKQPKAVWIAVPVAPLELMEFLQECCDRVIVLAMPQSFFSVSRFYEEFPQVEMKEAFECLRQQTQSNT